MDDGLQPSKPQHKIQSLQKKFRQESEHFTRAIGSSGTWCFTSAEQIACSSI